MDCLSLPDPVSDLLKHGKTWRGRFAQRPRKHQPARSLVHLCIGKLRGEYERENKIWTACREGHIVFEHKQLLRDMDFYAFYLTPWFWLTIAVLALIIEAASAFNLTTIWFALAAFVMVAVSGISEMYDVTIPIKLHWGIFLSLSLILLIFTRAFAIKKLKVGRVKTNVDSLVGSEALVIRDIPKFGKGEVKIGGQIWSASSVNQSEIPAGQTCTILEVRGVTLFVRFRE